MSKQNDYRKVTTDYIFAGSALTLVVMLAMLITSNVEEAFLNTWLAMFFIACVPSQAVSYTHLTLPTKS